MSSSGGNSAPQTGVVSYTRPRPNLTSGPDARNSDVSRGESTSLLDTPVLSLVPTLSPTHSSPHAGSLSPGAAGESELTSHLHNLTLSFPGVPAWLGGLLGVCLLRNLTLSFPGVPAWLGGTLRFQGSG